MTLLACWRQNAALISAGHKNQQHLARRLPREGARYCYERAVRDVRMTAARMQTSEKLSRNKDSQVPVADKAATEVGGWSVDRASDFDPVPQIPGGESRLRVLFGTVTVRENGTHLECILASA